MRRFDLRAVGWGGRIAFAVGLVACLAVPAKALDPLIEVGGGGPKSTDCRSTIKANATIPSGRPRHVRCTDGDSTCDADGTVDGVCTFQVVVCANSTFDPNCSSTAITSLTVEHSDDNGFDPLFDTDFQALQAAVDSDIQPSSPIFDQDACTSPPTNIRVRIKGPFGPPLTSRHRCKRNIKKLRLFTQPHPLSGPADHDLVKLICNPNFDDPNNLVDPEGCRPDHLFADTFDRLQKQVFSASCALGTCHDSQSYVGAGGLLLEAGAAYTNLVNTNPQNGDAFLLGWKRVDPGSSATSFLYHKVTDDLDDAPNLGLRMPRPPGRPKLHPSLREIIRLWIDAGAPMSGWVPGTD